jgi:aspartate ammonia-lyase
VRRSCDRLRATENALFEIPLGGTAVGTGVNTKPKYKKLAVERLRDISGLPLREAKNPVSLTQSLGDFIALSAALRCLAIELSKICNDLRLLIRALIQALTKSNCPRYNLALRSCLEK